MAVGAFGLEIQNVRGMQRKGTNLVDIWYDLISADDGAYDVSIKLEGMASSPYPNTLTGDFGMGVTPGRNKWIVWNAGKDFPMNADYIRAHISATRENHSGMVRIPAGVNNGFYRWCWPENIDIAPIAYTLTNSTAFWMDKTEITYAHWRRVWAWALEHGYSFDNPGQGKGANHPVCNISGYDAVKWCNARSEMEKRPCVYLLEDGTPMRTGKTWSIANLACGGYRLPTWDEWEYAARGGLASMNFPWGNVINHSRANYLAKWHFWEDQSSYEYLEYDDYLDNAVRIFDDNPYDGFHPAFDDVVQPFTAPVGSFAPNGYGLYDMAGNVTEYLTTSSGLHRAMDGGNWYVEMDWCLIGYIRLLLKSQMEYLSFELRFDEWYESGEIPADIADDYELGDERLTLMKKMAENYSFFLEDDLGIEFIEIEEQTGDLWDINPYFEGTTFGFRCVRN